MGRVETLNQILEEMRAAREGSPADDRAADESPPSGLALSPAADPRTPPNRAARLSGDGPVGSDGIAAAASPEGRSTIRRPPRQRHLEAELKLVAAPDAMAMLIEAAPIVAQARNKGTVRVLRTVYYDTPGCTLFRSGVVLRVRQSGKRFVQAVRMLAETPNEPLRHRDWETLVTSLMPDSQALLPLMSMGLQDVLSRDPLQPVFSIELRRHVRALALPGGSVEATFDSGVLRTGDRSMPIGDVRLRLQHGSAAALHELALLLSDHGAIRPDISSKAQRGFELAMESVPPVHTLRQPLPNGDLSLDDALAAILQSALQQLLANQAAAQDGRDPEGVHQLRIALRRLRCAFALMRPLARSAALEELRADAKWLLSGLGAARNWDVFLTQVLAEVAQGCGAIEGFDLVRELAEKSRQTGYVTARALLADRRAGRFALALGAWTERREWQHDVAEERRAELAEPALAFATRILAKQHARVLKRGRGFKRLPIEARHDLRLAVKKLRYTADFFLPLLGEPGTAKRYARRLSRLQERLGRYNDVGTTRGLLGELAVDGLPAAARQALGAVLGWQACRLVGVETEVRAAWRAFRDAALPWTQARGRGEGRDD
jgi:inorganic triphosphatase YgiF